ncbi:hypothetical protein M1K46_19310 [Fictibacillus sp. WQ 8-8]|uniref:hypothetical protein n=1 Tax=Fictibacillus sp. WQ 8-8 TaxID=2938788 RepID=UPI00210D3DE0|nr:hypothetical protein [Fictibacillus sp. WQ 8-8]MCQ6267780.1 hypothetical protein [Fictibacillus sp. WQ 8-8]
MEAEAWNKLENKKREKAVNLITEFSSIAVSWNDMQQKKILDIFSQLITTFQEEHNLKPHELMVLSKMLQEISLTNLFEWLPSDFEDWKNKDELMATFFFGQEGLASYKEEKGKTAKLDLSK